jgi:uncharacterized protein (TIGR00297 family)
VAFDETKRQTLHVSMLAFALLLRVLPLWGALLCATVAFLHNLYVLPRTGRAKFYRPEDEARGYPLGILIYPVTVFLLILLFGSHMPIAGAAWAILAFGDGFATIVGRAIGRHKLPWCPDKSWEGSAAYVAFGGGAAVLVALWVGSPALDWLVATRHGFGATSLAWLVLVCAAGAVTAALVETLPLGIDDNLSAPLVAGFVMWVLWGLDLSRLGELVAWGEHNLLLGLTVSVAVAALSLNLGFVSKRAFAAGIPVGVLVVAGTGLRGFAVLLTFFVIGSAVSKFGYQKKAALGAAQDEGGRRGSKHAVANCSTGVLLGLVALVNPEHAGLLLLGMVASFATALGDTTSSELGSIYGKSPLLLTTFKRVPPGTEGAVSMEGTLIGVGFALLLSVVGWALGLIPLAGVLVSTAGAFVGMSFESYLGAATKSLDNELLNFLNTVVGAVAAMLLGAWVL